MKNNTNCSLCGSDTTESEMTGQTLVEDRLVSYTLCNKCVLEMPDNQASQYGKAVNDRQHFWDALKEQLRKQHHAKK